MIKFFRKTRQKLLTENKFSKYLIYAIGEIVLVAVGILIALQVNNWNENEKLKKAEIKILKEITKDLNQSLEEVERDYEAHQLYQNSANRFQNLITQNNSDLDSISKHFEILMNDRRSFSQTSGYFLLKSKGMYLISNDSLRTSITFLYEQNFSRLKNMSRLNPEMSIHRLLSPYLKKHFEISEKIRRSFMYEGVKDSITLYSYKLISLDKLKNDTELFIDLQESFDKRMHKMFLHRRSIEIIKQLLKDISKELGKLGELNA